MERDTRIKKTPAAYVGRVYATDAEAAVKQAIKEFNIKGEQQKRLVARREG